MSSAHASIRRIGTQHRSWRGGRVNSERGTHARHRTVVMIVCKFGGTSVADRNAIQRLIAIIRAARQAAIQPESRDWRGPIVVVSALGGATDRLLGLAAEAGAGDVDGARYH